MIFFTFQHNVDNFCDFFPQVDILVDNFAFISCFFPLVDFTFCVFLFRAVEFPYFSTSCQQPVHISFHIPPTPYFFENMGFLLVIFAVFRYNVVITGRLKTSFSGYPHFHRPYYY